MGNIRVLFVAILTFLYLSVYPIYSNANSYVFASSDIIGPWSSTLVFPNQIASHTSFAYNGNIYVAGGATNDDFSQTWMTTPLIDGNISSWVQNSNLPESRYWSSMAQKGNKVYLLGGAFFNGDTNYKNTVFIGTIDSSGLITWTVSLNSLPVSSGQGAAAIVGDRIFYAGGFNESGTPLQNIYSASIHPDGSIGIWSSQATPSGTLPTSLYGFSMISYHNKLIIIGGRTLKDNNTSATDKVYIATPDPITGVISSWNSGPNLPENVYRGSSLLIGSIIVSIAGESKTSFLNKIYYTSFDGNDSLSPWQTSVNTLPDTYSAGAAALTDGYVYVIGGYNGSYRDVTYLAKLDTDTILNVPSFKQTDPLWTGQIYDSAQLWAPSFPQFSNWGCAVTAAAMVFNYHGVLNIDNQTLLNPGTLDTWLKTQPDGYVGSGWVNWLALSRLSKLAKAANISTFSFDALSYNREAGYNPTQLKQDIGNNIPGILEVPGHFIVGKGIIGTSFSINDPYYSKSSLADYSNNFLSLSEFIPSHTDLSYMMFIVDEGITLSLKDASGGILGSGFIQQPLDQDGGIAKSGSPKYFYYLKIPNNGAYTLAINSSSIKKYKLQTFLYDKDANVKMDSISGITTNNSSDLYSIIFNKQNLNSSNIKQNVSFSDLLSDVDTLYSQKLLSLGLYIAIKAEITQAQQFLVRSRILSKVTLGAISIQLDFARGKSLNEEAYKILKPELTLLINSF